MFCRFVDPANYLAGARAKKILILVGFLEGFEAGEDETYP